MVKRGAKGDASILQPTVMFCVPLILDRIYKVSNILSVYKLEVEQGRGILCRTWFKLYYFNPTQASINDTHIVLATIPSPAGLTQIPQ